jgi:hypothetical protein
MYNELSLLLKKNSNISCKASCNVEFVRELKVTNSVELGNNRKLKEAPH